MATFKFTATDGEILIGTEADDIFTVATDSDLDAGDLAPEGRSFG
jgi:hypothetical protein